MFDLITDHRSNNPDMKKILFSLCFLPFSVFAQSQSDYEQEMAKFVKLYNSSKTDEICAMFGKNPQSDEGCSWEQSNREAKSIDKLGTIQSFKYLGVDKSDPEQVTVFQIHLSKAGTKAMSFTLHSTSSAAAIAPGPYIFETFRFTTTSEEIEKMMKPSRK